MSDVSRLPGPLDHAWQWQRLGACRGMDSAVFFHPDGERNPSRARRTAQAKEVCQRCPVMDLCREFALQTREPFGVWGGLAVLIEVRDAAHRAGIELRLACTARRVLRPLAIAGLVPLFDVHPTIEEALVAT